MVQFMGGRPSYTAGELGLGGRITGLQMILYGCEFVGSHCDGVVR